MIVEFTTESGSVYRVDYAASTIERLHGESAPTPRIGSSGARRFASVSALIVGAPVLIVWGEFSATPPVDPDATPATETSPVRHVRRVDVDAADQPQPVGILDAIFSAMEPEVHAAMRRAGLDPTDETVVETLSDPCDFETFNARLDALISAKRRPVGAA